MTYLITLKDGRTYLADESKTRRSDAETAMLKGVPLRINGGDVVSGTMIGSVGKVQAAVGPHSATLPALVHSVFGAKYGELFWNKIVRMNKRREVDGKPWLYGRIIRWAVEENEGSRDLDTLEAFIEAEWATARAHNRPRLPSDVEGARLIREYLASDGGREYAATIARYTR